MAFFRKKPVVIEAFRWTGGPDQEDDPTWIVDALRGGSVRVERCPELHMEIDTLEGTMRAFPGEWIICGVKGEIYPCKPDIFAATYEPASTTRAPGGEPPDPWPLDKVGAMLAEGRPVLPEERGTGGRCLRCGLGMNNGGNLSQSGDGPEVHICAAAETPATGPCDVCGGAFHEGERGWPVWQFGAAWNRKVHKRCEAAPSPRATRGDGGTGNE